jgi:hypothetical protein
MNLNVAASCYDYNDFNAQHRLVLMLRLSSHTTIGWHNDSMSAVLSGLFSGVRATDFTNTFLNMAYKMLDDSFETVRFISAVILADRPKPY